jgi:hypothetical protein
MALGVVESYEMKLYRVGYQCRLYLGPGDDASSLDCRIQEVVAVVNGNRCVAFSKWSRLMSVVSPVSCYVSSIWVPALLVLLIKWQWWSMVV